VLPVAPGCPWVAPGALSPFRWMGSLSRLASGTCAVRRGALTRWQGCEAGQLAGAYVQACALVGICVSVQGAHVLRRGRGARAVSHARGLHTKAPARTTPVLFLQPCAEVWGLHTALRPNPHPSHPSLHTKGATSSHTHPHTHTHAAPRTLPYSPAAPGL